MAMVVLVPVVVMLVVFLVLVLVVVVYLTGAAFPRYSSSILPATQRGTGESGGGLELL